MPTGDPICPECGSWIPHDFLQCGKKRESYSIEKKKQMKQYEVPEILYEVDEKGNQTSQIPYIEVPQGKTMPPVLFIFEYKHTGETEPDNKGKEVPILDQIPHKYVDLELLKAKLPPHLNDLVRQTIGLDPLAIAKEKGQQILDKINSNVDKIKEQIQKTNNTKKDSKSS